MSAHSGTVSTEVVDPKRDYRRQSSATVLEIENLPVTLCSWDTEQAKIRMDRIVTMRGDQPPQSLQAVMQASTTSSNALPPGELRQHQFNQRTGSFIEAQPSPQSYINFTATATSRPGTTQGPRSVMLSDSAPDLAAPPPSLYTDAGMLNSAEQAYHSARLAEQNDSSTSSDRRRRQSGGVEGLEKMTVSNPDGAEHTETQESPPRLPPQAPQEALKSEKQRFEDASRSVRKASEERALPTPYQQVADNKLRQQQGAYPTPGPAQDPRPAEADPWKAKNAQYLSNLAVAACTTPFLTATALC